jgi:hypothetical protein
MRDVIQAIKYWILYKLEIPAPEINHLDNEVQYLRNELTIAREEVSRLTNLMYSAAMVDKNSNGTNELEDENPEPIRGKYIPWPIRRAHLEKLDRQRAAELAREAQANKVKINTPKIEEAIQTLEEELGVNSNDAIRNG